MASSDVGGAYLSAIYSKDSLLLFAVEQSRYSETSDAAHFLQLTDVLSSSGFKVPLSYGTVKICGFTYFMFLFQLIYLLICPGRYSVLSERYE